MTQAHPWIKSYPEGVRWDIEIEPEPVQKILDDAAAKWPERPRSTSWASGSRTAS